MASSGSFNTTAYSGRYLTFSWTEKSQDIAKNQTTIEWTLKGAGGDSTWYKTGAFKVVIDGKTVYSSSTRIQLSNGTKVASGTYTFTHANDGTKKFKAYAEAAIYTYAVNCKGEKEFTLDTIPRKSTLAVSNGTLDTAQTLTITEAASSFTHKIYAESGTSGKQYILGSASATSSTLSFSWTPPASLASQNTTGTSVSVKFTLETYSGSTLIGSNSYTKTFTIPNTSKFQPKCSMTLDDVSGWDNTYGSPVQSLSRIKVTINPTLAYGSPIASYEITIDGKKYTSKEITTAVLRAAGTSPVTVKVKDKRGRTGSATYNMNVQAYNPPQVTKLAVHRVTDGASYEENPEGTYVHVQFAATVTALNNKNTAEYTIRYKKSVDTQYTEFLLGKYANTYKVDTTSSHGSIFSADPDSSYDVEIVVKDAHSTTTRATSASTAFSLMNFGADGTSMSIGGIAEEPNTLGVFLTTKFHKVTALVGGDKRTLTLTADFKVYSGQAANTPWCRKTSSGLVEVRGAVSPTAADNAIGTNTATVICTLPVGFRPAEGFYQLCQGSGNALWLLSVAPDGTVGAARHRDVTGPTTPGTSSWLPFHITFIAD